MKKILCLLFLPLLLAGCGPKPAPWLATGYQQMENFKMDFLSGSAPIVTEMHFTKAVEEIKKSGDLDLLGRVWLTRMSLQVAVLAEIEGGDYPKIEAAQAVPANRNFYLFLKGDTVATDRALLPAQYRPFLTALLSGDAAETGAAVAKIDDPLSRLIAAGLTVRRYPEDESLLRTAVETASRNGWKRALLVWLKRLGTFYEAAGEAAKAAAVRQRIDLITS
jgi:hypothetical protein